MKKYIYSITISLLAILAIPVMAAPNNLRDVINDVFLGGIIRPLVPFLIGLAVVIFIYGVITTILAEGGEKKEDGKKFMFWGIIGIFVMVSVWGLVAILKNTFKLENTPQTINIDIPKVDLKIN
jgi:zinc transporter ZupT